MKLSLSVSVVFPLFCYLAIGYIARKLNIINKEATKQFNRLMFYLFLPLTIFNNVVNSGDAIKNGSGNATLIYLLVFFTVVFTLLCIFVPIFIKDRRRQGAFIQAVYRGNTLLFAMPVAQTLMPSSMAIMSVVVVVIVTYHNLLCISMLEVKRGGKINVINLLKSILKNPNIQYCIAGFIFLIFNIQLPTVVNNTINSICNCTTPIALILLGADLSFSSIKKDLKHLSIGCFLKLIVSPAIAFLVAYKMGFKEAELIAIFAVNCVPSAVASYSVAVEMDSDAEFAGEMIAISSVLSIITVFLWILVLPLV